MNRADFMKNLAELLVDVSPAEREEAIQYYNDYFDDAGAENEQSVIASLGTPEQLAKTIKAGLADGGNAGEFTEKGFSGYEQRRANEVLNPNQPEEKNGTENGAYYGNSGASGQENHGNAGTSSQFNGQSGYGYWQGDSANHQNSYGAQGQYHEKKDKKMSGGMIVLIVFLGILAFPFVIGIGGGFLGLVGGLLAGLFGIVVGVGAASVGLLIAGIILFVYGITLLFGTPLAGLCVMGAAMVLIALGLLFLWIIVMICAFLIPTVVRGVVKLVRSIFHIGGAKA